MRRLIRRTARLALALAGLLLVAACGAQPSLPAAGSSAPPVTASPTAQAAAPQEHTFEGARSIALALAADGAVYAVLGVGQELLVARAAADGAGFSEPARASGTIPAIVNPVERPSLALDQAGRLAVSWLERRDDGQIQVWYSQSSDGGRSFGEPQSVSRADGREGAMVTMIFDGERRALITWLQDGALALARADGDGVSFAATETIDAEVCDCCQPAPLVQQGRLLIAFRNVVQTAADDLRDIYVVASEDGGRSFGPPVLVSDASWPINACPISGPALSVDGQRLYVAWMDGRDDTARTGTRGDLWLASSTDGGRSFTPNVRVNPERVGYHTLPALAVGPDGRLHISWELHADQRSAIVYSTSDDHGATFASPQELVRSDDDAKRGDPSAPALLATPAGRVYVAWTDRLGAHVRSWDAGATPAAQP